MCPALEAAGIKTVSLSAKSAKNAVRLGTMHGMKGLEFQAVAVIGVADGTMPAPGALTDVAEDPVAHTQALQRERCPLFVACTRARDHLYVSYGGAPSPFLQHGQVSVEFEQTTIASSPRPRETPARLSQALSLLAAV